MGQHSLNQCWGLIWMDFIQLNLWQHTALIKGLTKGKPLGTGSQEIPAFSSFVEKTLKSSNPQV